MKKSPLHKENACSQFSPTGVVRNLLEIWSKWWLVAIVRFLIFCIFERGNVSGKQKKTWLHQQIMILSWVSHYYENVPTWQWETVAGCNGRSHCVGLNEQKSNNEQASMKNKYWYLLFAMSPVFLVWRSGCSHCVGPVVACFSYIVVLFGKKKQTSEQASKKHKYRYLLFAMSPVFFWSDAVAVAIAWGLVSRASVI